MTAMGTILVLQYYRVHSYGPKDAQELVSGERVATKKAARWIKRKIAGTKKKIVSLPDNLADTWWELGDDGHLRKAKRSGAGDRGKRPR